jgi:hypothetical protein
MLEYGTLVMDSRPNLESRRVSASSSKTSISDLENNQSRRSTGFNAVSVSLDWSEIIQGYPKRDCCYFCVEFHRLGAARRNGTTVASPSYVQAMYVTTRGCMITIIRESCEPRTREYGRRVSEHKTVVQKRDTRIL